MSYAVITGASKGIGCAIAEQLAMRGYDLILVARSADLLQQVANRLSKQYSIRTDCKVLDLSLPEAPSQLLAYCTEKRYPINILVNNAGYGLSGPFEKIGLPDLLNMMDVNMAAMVSLTHLFLPSLSAQPKSYILNISSSAAYQAVPFLAVYAATKSFVLSFSRGLAEELSGSNVSVTSISPGATDTDFVVRAKIGEKGVKAASKLNMSPGKVAKLAVQAMLAGKREIITGGVNKLGAAMAWLLPKQWVEKTAKGIYK